MRTCQILQIAVLLFTFLKLSRVVNAQADVIYTIRISDGSGGQRLQTGFRLKGMPGILTTLHGVADASRMTAFTENEDTGVVANLKLEAVNVTDDLALLTSPLLESDDGRGIEAAPTGSVKPLAVLRAFGHPKGINLYNISVPANSKPYKPLLNVLPGELMDRFSERRSPDPNGNILNFDAPLGPGYSGGPLLDSANRVVGVIDGGLQGGLNICWAIPIEQTNELRPLRESSGEVRRIRKLGGDGLFAWSQPDMIPNDKVIGTWRPVATGASAKGFERIRGKQGSIEIKRNGDGRLVISGEFRVQTGSALVPGREQSLEGTISRTDLKQYEAQPKRKRSFIPEPDDERGPTRYLLHGNFLQEISDSSPFEVTDAVIYFSKPDTFTLEFGDADSPFGNSPRIYWERDADDKADP